MSKTEADSVTALPNNGDQMDKIIEILQGKGDEDFQTFCKILRKANYRHWASELEKKAEELSKRIGEGTYVQKETVQFFPLFYVQLLSFMLHDPLFKAMAKIILITPRRKSSHA